MGEPHASCDCGGPCHLTVGSGTCGGGLRSVTSQSSADWFYCNRFRCCCWEVGRGSSCEEADRSAHDSLGD